MTTNQPAKKITLATFKSFIKKNRAALLINVGRTFDGMEDGVRNTGDKSFTPALDSTRGCESNECGIQGVWVVLGSRDYFSPFAENGMSGIRVSNCCGSFTVAIPDASIPLTPAPVVEAAPKYTAAQYAEASEICGEEIGEILSGGETLTGAGFDEVEVIAAPPARAGEPIPPAPEPCNVIEFPGSARPLAAAVKEGIENAVNNALDLYASMTGTHTSDVAKMFLESPEVKAVIDFLVFSQTSPDKLRAFMSKI